jgi:hypothetical protein
LRPRAQRHGELAARRGQSWQRNFIAQRRFQAERQHALAAGAAVGVHRRHVADADRHAFAQRHTGQASVGEQHFGARAGVRIAAARQRVQTGLSFVEHPQDGVLDAQVALQAIERCLQQGRQVDALGDAARHLSGPCGDVATRCQFGQRAGHVDAAQLQHLVQVGATQLGDQRGQARDPRRIDSTSNLAPRLQPQDGLPRGDDRDALVAAQRQQIALVPRGDEIGLTSQCRGQDVIVIGVGGHHGRHGLRCHHADFHAITGQAPIYLSPVNLAEIRFGIDLLTDTKQDNKAMAMLRRMRRKPLLSAPRLRCRGWSRDSACPRLLHR